MHFIVVDNNKLILNNIKDIIDNIMFKHKLDYKISCFENYDDSFYETFNIPSIKIYILDIEVNNSNGIDIARQIRNHSTEDYIIFISSYERKYKNPIFNTTIRYYSFINKSNINRLTPTIKNILQEVNRNNTLTYYHKGYYYQIKTNMILYIQTNKNKKTIIKTDDLYDRECPLNLEQLQKALGTNFIKTNRFYLINKQRATIYSFKDKSITFDNHAILKNCISRSFKKDKFEKLINL